MSALYCKAHINHHARHGSYWYGSLKAADLAPYRAAARHWVKLHREERWVGLIIHELDGLLALGTDAALGVPLKGLPAVAKARVTLGRLRAAGVTGDRLLEVALGVAALVGVRGIVSTQYLEVQIAKVVMRMHAPTAGTRWHPSDSRARATGKGLRVLGHHIWFYANLADQVALEEIARNAQPLIAGAQRDEAKRLAMTRVRRNTEAAIERNILKARDYGMGPAELDEMRAKLRQRYGLG